MCFAALIFASRLNDPQAVIASCVVFAAFSLASSASYALNDAFDLEADRAHPTKRTRPVASGRISRAQASALAIVLAAVAVGLTLPLPRLTTVILVAFLVLNVAYSARLKHVAVLDVMLIATDFALRVQGGIAAIGAPQSAWILLTVFFGALFLGFAKRRGELSVLGAAAGRRITLDSYSLPLLDVLLVFSATTAMVCYALYAVTVQRQELFVLTVLPVVFGIARYLLIVFSGDGTDDPVIALSRDWPIVGAVAVWVVMCVAVVYLAPPVIASF